MITINGKQINITMFPDKTSQVWHLEDLYGDVHWKFESEAEVMHLAQLALLMRKSFVPRHLVIEYLPYGRQDKEVVNDQTFALRAFAIILNSMNWESVTINDPHSQVALNIISKSKAKYFAHEAQIAMKAAGSHVICFPDKGAVTKYEPLFWGVPSIHAEKHRDAASGKITGIEIIGDIRGERVMIVDDICDGGATFIGLAKKLYDGGALDVCLFVSHGLFTKGMEVLYEAGISKIFTPKTEL